MPESMRRRLYTAEKLGLALGLAIAIPVLFGFVLAISFSSYCNRHLFGRKEEQGFCPVCGQRIANHDDRACDFRSGNQAE
jgi:hypothetical protein